MSNFKEINIAEWVDRVRPDPVRHVERQAAEIVLNAIGLAALLRESVFLKGGTLMGVVYKSTRQTADLDFTTNLKPNLEIDQQIREALDKSLPVSAARLGFPDMVLQVQTLKRQPASTKGRKPSFPALLIKIAYAQRNTTQDRQIVQRNGANCVTLDIRFNEPVQDYQIIKLGANGSQIRAYSLVELMAEKLRAFLQQKLRNRSRRQDIYDLALLTAQFPLDLTSQTRLLEILLAKSAARNIKPTATSMDDPDLIECARSEWKSLALEIGKVPDFESCFATVRAMYLSLPWP